MSKVSQILVEPVVTEEELDKISNTFVDFSIDKFKLITEDSDVYTVQNGKRKIILRFRKHVLPDNMCSTLWSSLKSVGNMQRGRSEATGMKKDEIYSMLKSLSTGKYIRQMNSKAPSGIIGYYDNKSFMGHRRIKSDGVMCRLTSFSKKNIEKYEKALPIISYIDSIYEKLGGDHYKCQKDAIDKLNPDFRIENTAYTTVTVNRNFRTALHKDKGDFKGGMINLAVVSDGNDYGGCYTMLPKYGIAIDCRPSDFLIFDTYEYHCNSEKTGEGERLSLVLYLREKMLNLCPKPITHVQYESNDTDDTETESESDNP